MKASPPAVSTRTDFGRNPAGFRAAAIVVILVANSLYYPINRGVSGGMAPMTPADKYIHLHPVWAAPYVIAIMWWISALLWAAFQMELPRLKMYTLALVLMTFSSYVVYIAYPTYVIRPELAGEGWAIELMRLIYGNDQPYNALPSGHTYHTALIAIFWWHWKPRWRWLWLATIPVVALSTLFTKQHYLLDPVFGAAWAFGAYFLAKKITGWSPAEKNS